MDKVIHAHVSPNPRIAICGWSEYIICLIHTDPHSTVVLPDAILLSDSSHLSRRYNTPAGDDAFNPGVFESIKFASTR